MKVTFEEVVASVDAMKEMAGQKFKSAKTGYRMGRILKAADGEVQEYQAALAELLKEYAVQDETEPKNWLLQPDSRDTFERKHKELLAVEVEIWGDPVEVGDLEGIELSAGAYAQLGWLIREPAEPLQLVDRLPA